MNIIGNEGSEEDTKESIMGALTLYLDFINIYSAPSPLRKKKIEFDKNNILYYVI